MDPMAKVEAVEDSLVGVVPAHEGEGTEPVSGDLETAGDHQATSTEVG